MVKKITTVISVFAFASAASIAMACDKPSSCPGKDEGAGLSNIEQFEVAGSGCGDSCNGKKNP